MASDGPGFLAPRQTINVVFRDGQGIRIGSSVRVAGLDTGNVVDVDLVEVEGTLPRGSGFHCRRAWSRSCVKMSRFRSCQHSQA